MLKKALQLSSLCLITACGGPLEEQESSFLETPPQNTEKTVSCPLSPLPASFKSASFRNQTIRFYNAEEIGYQSADWFINGKPWISWEGFDSSILGYPGFPGTSRSFKVSQPVNLRITAVDVRNIEGKLHYHYFSNETANSPMENWSSTKAFVMLQAAHSIRSQTNGSAGLLSTVSGGSEQKGEWIGTHVNRVARTSHNETANWFKSITGSQGSENFVRNWIGSSATFGGLHSTTIAGLGNRVKARNSGSEMNLPLAMTWKSNGQSNTLMPIVMAEFWKRLAVNEKDPVTWLKKAPYAGPVLESADRMTKFFNPTSNFGVTVEDLQVLFYGYVNSSQNGGLQLGATQHDEIVKAFGGKTRLDQLTLGRWRLFGKTGSGFSDERGRDEAAFGGFLCIPADPSRSELPEGRLIAFFMNIQTHQGASKYAVRNNTLRNLSRALIPELNDDPSLWQ